MLPCKIKKEFISCEMSPSKTDSAPSSKHQDQNEEKQGNNKYLDNGVGFNLEDRK